LIEVLIAVALLAAAAYFVSGPLRNPETATGEGEDAELADLEARKEAKYREIRDTELDRASGKLSEEDFRRQDAELRRQASDILERIRSRRKPGSVI
jgi:uncharacterized membrane protein YccC